MLISISCVRHHKNDLVREAKTISYNGVDLHFSWSEIQLVFSMVCSDWWRYYKAICYSPPVGKSAGFENQNSGG